MVTTDWGALAAAIGPVATAVIAVLIALSKSGFLAREDHGRGDVMTKLEKISDKIEAGRKENETEFRAIRDRLTVVETTSKEQGRRLDRADR